ncbi:hypothetical protein KAU33_04605 [Candidatus Dependentiae bacterium]|nr:hypothetical protein [Candidatus Dependentiae bacterium]
MILNRKPRNFWTDETIIIELKPIIKELSHFPVERELRDMNKHGLRSAIVNHGGIARFRKLLGYKAIRKPYNYWNEKKIVLELNEIIEKLGFFPTKRKICEMGKGDLSNAIINHGGFIKFRIIFGSKITELKEDKMTI